MTPSAAIFTEIGQIPDAVANAAGAQVEAAGRVARATRGRPLRLIATIARGSSDHAASFLRYACELGLGVAGASISPSIASIYRRRLDLEGALCLVVSQSGRSPDLLSAAAMARQGGALVVAIVNDAGSPLAAEADVVIPVGAGAERAVAATKSFVGSAVAGLRLLAAMTEDAGLRAALDDAPRLFAGALAAPPIDLEPTLAARSTLVVARGAALGVAQEAALKMKEILRHPAEAFSSAEVRHGPWELAHALCGLIVWPSDPALSESQRTIARDVRGLGAPVLDLGEPDPSTHPLLAPLERLPAFYLALARAAVARGLDPDSPRLLRKVTETL